MSELPQYQPGQLVRFRLGERMPEPMPCCGQIVDDFAVLYEQGFSGSVFTVGDFAIPICSCCQKMFEPDKGKILLLTPRFEVNGHPYHAFGAYPRELELVEE